jgi:transposase
MTTNNPSEGSETEEMKFAAFIGVDWGDSSHALALFEPGAASTEIQSSTLKHTPEAIHGWVEMLEKRFGGRPVALAVEASKGPLLYAIMEVPWLVIYPIHTTTSARYRQAFRPSGAKDDLPDALVLLDLVRHHRHKLQTLCLEDGQTRQLAYLCAMRRGAVDHRTQLSNELTSTLKAYFPQALEWAGEKLHSAIALDFLHKWPDLLALKTARPATIKNFYYRHNVRRPELVEERLKAIAQARALTTDEAIVSVNVRKVAMLVEMLRTLTWHITSIEKEIARCFKEHPEAALFRELPGAGATLAPRLLVAFGCERKRYPECESLLKYSGVAPVLEKSGSRQWVHWRWHAPTFLRQTFIEWAGQTVVSCPWSRAYYQQQKTNGKKHWAILRSLAFKWIRILWRCWQSRTPYNEATYLAALQRKNSKLLPAAA